MSIHVIITHTLKTTNKREYIMNLSNTEIAQEIKNTCQNLGWECTTRGSILTIIKKITPNSKESFRQADMEYYSILDLLPSTSAGSVWGTDGGGVGAISATKSGTFVMNKSGGSMRVLSALSKML